MDEKRKLMRRRPRYSPTIYDRESNELIGQLEDYSVEGMMISSSEPLPVKQKYQMKMAIPIGKEEVREIIFDGESLWCNQGTSPGSYNTGFQLTKVSPEDLEIIEQLVEETLDYQ
jgi:hypothetical protein